MEVILVVSSRSILLVISLIFGYSGLYASTASTASMAADEQRDACSICLERLTNFPDTVSLMCTESSNVPHRFHTDCIKYALERQVDCPLCREPICQGNNAMIAVASYSLRYPEHGRKILNAQLSPEAQRAAPIIIEQPAVPAQPNPAPAIIQHPGRPQIPAISSTSKLLFITQRIIMPTILGASVGTILGLAFESNPYSCAAVTAAATVMGSLAGNYLSSYFAR